MRHRFVRTPPIFNPANLTLNGWWRGSFSASPWTGATSLGTSASNDLTEATNPPSIGISRNGYTAADFDGTNDILGGNTLATYLSASEYTIAILMYIEGVGANANAGTGEVLSDTTGDICLNTYEFSTGYAGLVPQHNDGAWKTLSGSIVVPTNSWQLLFVRYYGATSSLYGRVGGNNNWTYSTGVGNLAATGGTLRVGASKAAYSRFFNGQIQELIIAPSFLNDSACDGIEQYVKWRYDLTF